MHLIAVIVGLSSGFLLSGYHQPTVILLATSLAVDASLAPLTTIIASRRSRSPALWAIVGFALGVWALAYVLLVRPRHHPAYPPTSDAA